jgi:hypothetical protein
MAIKRAFSSTFHRHNRRQPPKGPSLPCKIPKILWPFQSTLGMFRISSQLAWRSSLGSSTEQLESENCSSSSGTSCVAVGSHRVQGWRVFWEWNYWCFSGWKTNNCGIFKKWGLIWGFLDQHLGGFHQHMDRRLEGNKWRGLKHEAEHHCIVFFQDNPYFWTCYGLITCARKKIQKLVFGCHRWYLPYNSQVCNWFYLFGVVIYRFYMVLLNSNVCLHSILITCPM